MRDITKTILFWSPRLLTMLFALFLSMFAMDAFNGKAGFGEQIKDFLIHLIPTFLILSFLCMAWKWEAIGAVVYFGLAGWYVVSCWGKFPLSVYFIIALPLIIIASLFLVNWLYHKEIHNRLSY